MYTKIVHRTVLITLLVLAYPAASFAGSFAVGVTVGVAPPPLPVYAQPPCPAPGYIWAPGYWAYSYDAGDYFWVPGTWVLAPAFGLLWTPGYWGVVDAEYVWHEGYWGPHVGFYGGINYGFGYFGSGFVGGYWRDRNFYYNRAVTNVSNVSVTHVYNRTVINNNSFGSRPSFNGANGVHALPSRGDLLARREAHRAPTPQQGSQAASARARPVSLASVNHGHPQVAATPRPGVFHSSAYRSPQVREQHAPIAAARQHGGLGASIVRNPAAESRTMLTRPAATPSHRPEQPYRAGSSYSSPPGRAFAQHNAPALRSASQAPPHVNREAPPQGQRRS
jgi:hypothetical protein